MHWGHLLDSTIRSTVQDPLALHEARTVVLSLANHVPYPQAYDKGLDPYVVGARASNDGMALSSDGGVPQSIAEHITNGD